MANEPIEQVLRDEAGRDVIRVVETPGLALVDVIEVIAPVAHDVWPGCGVTHGPRVRGGGGQATVPAA